MYKAHIKNPWMAFKNIIDIDGKVLSVIDNITFISVKYFNNFFGICTNQNMHIYNVVQR